MKKLVLSGAAIVALLVGPASAADIVVRPIARAPQAVYVNQYGPVWQRGPIGVAGARWGNLCWVDVDSGRYYGYWRPCPGPVVARTVRVARTGVPIIARY